MKLHSRRLREQGATSLIIVVFCILLLTVISVGFMRLVVQDQERSLSSELSQGAYDSAQAGVEDGKRTLEACRTEGSLSDACKSISDGQCDTTASAGFVSLDNNEVKLQTVSGAGDDYAQAYTCVIVSPYTQDYEGSLSSDTSRVIPLDATGSFTSITLKWFKKADIIGATVPSGSDYNLPTLTDWPSTTPPVMRVQLMMYKRNGFKVASFDTGASSGTAGTNTLYLYPDKNGLGTVSFVDDSRAGPDPDHISAPLTFLKGANCGASVDAVYLCKVNITLPKTVTKDTGTTGYGAYLRVTPYYGATDYAVELPGTTKFDWVQPSIDSTGRASDVFRRVDSRVELADSQVYPRATVDTTDDFTKAFGVTRGNGTGHNYCPLTSLNACSSPTP